MSDRAPCGRCGRTDWLWRHPRGFCFWCVEGTDIERVERLRRYAKWWEKGKTLFDWTGRR